MQATYTEESANNISDIKDVNAWYALEQMLKPLQQEICEEIDREILKKLAHRAREENTPKMFM